MPEPDTYQARRTPSPTLSHTDGGSAALVTLTASSKAIRTRMVSPVP